MNDCTYLSASTESNRTHGGVKHHYHTDVGSKGRFDSLQAAVIIGKWSGFKEEVKARGEISARYSELMQDRVTTPKITDGNTHVYAQYTIRVDAVMRDDIRAGLKVKGIPMGIYYPKCFHEQPAFKYLGYDYGDFPESERASREVMSLLMHPFLSKNDQNNIVDTLITLIEERIDCKMDNDSLK